MSQKINDPRLGTVLVSKGKSVFSCGENIMAIALVLKGRIETVKRVNTDEGEKKCILTSLNPGYLVGLQDLLVGNEYINDYIAAEDTMIKTIYVSKRTELEDNFSTEKDLFTYAIITLCKSIGAVRSQCMKIFDYINKFSSLDIYLKMCCAVYGEQYSFLEFIDDEIVSQGRKIKKDVDEAFLPVPNKIDFSYFLSELLDYCKDDANFVKYRDREWVQYYDELSKIKLDYCKDFFRDNKYVAVNTMLHAAKVLNSIEKVYAENMQTLILKMQLLNKNNDTNLYAVFVKAILSLKEKGNIPDALLDIIESIRFMYDEVDAFLCNVIQDEIYIYKTDFIDLYRALYEKVEAEGSQILSEERMDMKETLRGSAKKIVDYSGIAIDKGVEFLAAVESIRMAKTIYAFDPVVTAARKKINQLFPEIYTKVYLKTITDVNVEIPIKMFLNFAFVDERLIEVSRLTFLYKLTSLDITDRSKSIFSMKEWLDEILYGKKMPSLNEVDLDYVDNLREMKKSRAMTEEEQTRYLEDQEGKVIFEVENMLKCTMKMCNAQISTFIPILHNELILGDVEKLLVSAERLNTIIDEIVDIDFSIFHREVLFYQTSKKSSYKEYIMKAVKPDFIIVPVYGTKVVSWQEISGRSRSMPGRIIVPLFAGENLRDMVIRAFGQYRWDLCRSVMGMAWNNIQVHSLTSEYSDYIQCYKKNNRLSETVKDKIKQQLVSCRNSNRDFFAEDYLNWIKYEVEGSVRVNKVAREMLVKYCIPNKNIREKLKQQAIFRELIEKWELIRTKKIRDLENKYSKLREAGEYAEELEENYKFFTE